MGKIIVAAVTSPQAALDSFDYSEIEGSVAAFLRGQAARLRRLIGKSLIQIGRDLLGAKRYLSHGAFMKWVESEVGIPARTAQGYMRIAQWVEGKSTAVAQLSPSLLYLLSAETTPPTLVAEVLSATEAGQSVSISYVRERIRAHRSDPSSVTSTPHVRQDTQRDRLRPVAREPVGRSHDTADELVEVACILCRALSAEERRRVHDVLTNPNMLYDENLAKRFALAFELSRGSENKLGLQAGGHHGLGLPKKKNDMDLLGPNKMNSDKKTLLDDGTRLNPPYFSKPDAKRAPTRQKSS